MLLRSLGFCRANRCNPFQQGYEGLKPYAPKVGSGEAGTQSELPTSDLYSTVALWHAIISGVSLSVTYETGEVWAILLG